MKSKLKVLSVVWALSLWFMASWNVLAAPDTIDVNHATAAELSALTGIGRARAAAIVAYRKDHPPFRTPQDLLKVRGIGRVVLEHNRDRLRFVIDDEQSAASRATSR